MAPVTMGIIALVIFLILISMGMPIGFTFAVIGFVGFMLLRGMAPALNLLGHVPYTQGSNYALVVIPLFLLMGNLAFVSGISTDLYNTAHKWTSRLPGGLAIATTLACTGFAACSGSSLATTATMGAVAAPEMKKYNYRDTLISGSIASGGTLGILIPPSIIFIIYGVIAGTSIGKLFLAGILPGLLLSGLFVVIIYIMCRVDPSLGPRGTAYSWKERFKSLSGVWGMLLLFIMVIGGIYAGIFTATEAGALGAFGAFIITAARRKLTLSRFSASLKETARVTAMVFMLVIGAQIFNSFLAISGLPSIFTKVLTTMRVAPIVIVILVLVVYIPLGMIMDALPMILLTMPTIAPVIRGLGYDLIWFGVLVTVMSGLANISPPMGMNLYIFKGVAKDIPLTRIFLGVAPFAVAMLVAVIILIFVPQISLFIPSLRK